MQFSRLRRTGRADFRVDIALAVGERPIAQPVHLAQLDPMRQQRFARADDHFALSSVDAHDIKWLGRGDADPASLADGVVDDAVVPAELAPVDMHDVARLRRIGAQFLDNIGVAAR